MQAIGAYSKSHKELREHESLQVLHNLVLAMCASLVYMVVLVTYVKGTFGVTLDVHNEIVLAFWGLIIFGIFTILEGFDKRSPMFYIRKGFK